MVKRMAVAAAALCSLAGTAGATDFFVTVSTASNSYSPQTIFIQPGDTVIWTYAGGAMPHNVRADDNSYSNNLSSAPWQFSHTFPTAMTSRYYCTAHGGPGGAGMSGTVVVGGRLAWSPADIVYTLDAWDFSPRNSTMTVGSPGAPDFHLTGPGTELVAGVQLPAGASITGFEVAGCDTGIDAINANLFRCLDPDASCLIVASVNSVGAPGCGFFGTALATPETVDNLQYTYLVRLVLGNNQSLRSVRVFHRKQVSPAPATPTFTDVPASDPRYRFVEALARAGITGGCGPGLYCPDAPLTRGQMAVFLSAALGLYWPN